MSTHSIRIPEPLEAELNNLVQNTGKNKTHIFLEALKSYIEDRADYLRAAAILEKIEAGEEKTTPFEEVFAKYGF